MDNAAFHKRADIRSYWNNKGIKFFGFLHTALIKSYRTDVGMG